MRKSKKENHKCIIYLVDFVDKVLEFRVTQEIGPRGGVKSEKVEELNISYQYINDGEENENR